MARHGGLPDALSRPDDRQRRNRREGQITGRLELEVRTDVPKPHRERPACPQHPLTRAENGLVGEIDHDLGAGVVQRLEERNAVLLPPTQLLGAADEESADEVERQLRERVTHDIGVVLPIDERDRPHEWVVTSDSMRAVYFSKASVSVENWMIFSCPWNGYLRQTSTCAPVISTTL